MNSSRVLLTDSATALATSLRQFFAGSELTRRDTPWRTRFAPAPTGFLHLGHVVNAMHVWGIARAHGGHVVLRIEDHDSTRCRPEFEEALLNDLDWLGLAADIGPANEFRTGRTLLRQSDKRAEYEVQLQRLQEMRATYACQCSRKDIASQGSENVAGETRYPGTCAALGRVATSANSLRVRVADDRETFVDIRLGEQEQRPSEQCGDFVVRDRNGNFTYQFAVTVDDWQQEIDLVIRGEDLLASTGRQLQLARMLGRNTPPSFLHHQLVLRDDGIKLSKSLGDAGVQELRAAGVSANEVLGRAAYASGLVTEPGPLAADELKLLFA